MILAKTILLTLAGGAVAAAITRRKRAAAPQLDHQLGGFAGPFASPGLGLDDADEASSGFSHHVLRRLTR
jgi:hypothetical protein